MWLIYINKQRLVQKDPGLIYLLQKKSWQLIVNPGSGYDERRWTRKVDVATLWLQDRFWLLTECVAPWGNHVPSLGLGFLFCNRKALDCMRDEKMIPIHFPSSVTWHWLLTRNPEAACGSNGKGAEPLAGRPVGNGIRRTSCGQREHGGQRADRV